MNGRTSKLLRKIAKVQGRSDKYIKREFKNMVPEMRRAYLEYMKENLIRIQDLLHKPARETIVLDQPIGKES